MYTHEIKSNENELVTVLFTYDTGKTEKYTEQITVSDAQFATEDTPFIPPVFEIITKTRPKLVTKTVTFEDNAELEDKIAAKLEELNKPFIPVPEPEPTPEPTEEELAAQEASRLEMEAKMEFETKKAEWLQKKAVLSTMIDDMKRGRELGIAPDETQVAIMSGLATWINANIKQEYYF